MNYLKKISIILSIGSLILVFGYINLQVSYKYEVDLAKTNIKTDGSLSLSEKVKQFEEINLREKKIIFQIKVIKGSTILFVILLITVIFLGYKKNLFN